MLATIIVVAVLTLLIFVLAIIGFHETLKNERKEIDAGNRDEEIKKEKRQSESKKYKIRNGIYTGISAFIICILAGLATTAIVYKASGEQFSVNNHVALVIASDSMNGFYDDDYETHVLSIKEDAANQQFEIGDILSFSKISEDDELVINDVYGYKNKKGQIITHRLIRITDNKYFFRGDNTAGEDSYVKRDQIILHYTENKLDRVGLFVLFSQSTLGLYSLLSVICVYILAEIYAAKYANMLKKRLDYLNTMPVVDAQPVEPVITPKENYVPKKSTRKVKADFYTKKGKHVVIYEKEGKKNEK